MKFFTANPTLRLAAGLVSLCATVVLIADLLVGVLPDRNKQALQTHRAVAETVAVLAAEALRTQDNARVAAVLDAARARNPQLLSAAVRREDGVLVARSGAHAADWASQTTDAAATNAQTQIRLIVPLHTAQGRWGRAEFAHPPAVPQTAAGWLMDRMLWLAIGLPLASILLAYVYLRRVLLHLNPLAVVPERLRDAFDGLTEGVALLDRDGRVVLANRALRHMAAVDEQQVHGRRFEDATGLKLAEPGADSPWARVLQGGPAQRGLRVSIGPAGGAEAERKPGILNCSPITDARGRVRGCMATVDDVSEVEQRNVDLRSALDELQRSRQQVQAQNDELVKLAMHDALTGLFNRRAFFDSGSATLQRAAAEGRRAAVLMIDVDHFKRFNDQYGHATGDAVLQRVGECLRRTLRQQDLVARYGGEEFCALLQDLSESEAAALAERLRLEIQRNAGNGLHAGRDLTVTASLGLCWLQAPVALPEMLRRADAALYEAKRSGRNIVRRALSAEPAALAEPA